MNEDRPHTKACSTSHERLRGDVETIVEIARRHNLMVLEDCASQRRHTARQAIGTFGDSNLSFQLNKSITAGEGA